MANDPITTKFKVDISEFKKGITEANRILKENKSELKSVASEMDLYGTSSDGVRKQLDLMKSSLEAQTKKLESYKSQLAAAEKYEKEAAENVEQLKKKLEQLAAQGFDETSDEVQKYQKELSSAEKTHESLKSQVSNLTSTMNNQQAEVNKAQKEFNDLEGELKDVEDAERKAAKTGQSVDDVLDDMADSADGASGGFTVLKGALANLVAEGIQMATQAIKDFVAETIKVGKEFDSSMSQVEAVSGATGSELEALRDKAKEMGANTVFSASEAADAFNYMAMAGWKTEDMLDGIEGVLNLAAASGTDLATTSDIVTDALTAMGYSAGDAGRLADVMAAASSNANTNVEMMGATFQYAAPIIGAMGYNMEDAAVAIGLMANAGIKGEKSGTALRSIMTRLAAPPKEAATAMEALGISITNADGSMKPLAEVMEILRQKFDGLGEAEQAQYAKQIAGQEAMSGLLAIVNAAPDDYEKLTEAVKNSNGAAEEMAATMQDNLGGDMTQLGSKIEGVQIALYEKFEPAMRKGVEVLSKLVDGMSFLVEHSTAVVTALKAMGAGVAAYVAYTTAIKVMEGGWMALTVVQKAAAAAQWLLNAAMSANPIGLIIAAVAALVVAFIALWKNSEEFRNFWINLWEKVKEVTKTAIDAVKGFFSGVIDWIKENWQGLALFLVNPIAGAFKLIYDNVEGFRNVVDNAVSAVKGFFTGLWEGLVGGFKAAIDWIKENWQSMLLFMMNPLAGVFKYCYEHFEGFRNFVDGIVQAVKGFFTGMWDGLKNGASAAWEGVKSIFSTVTTWLKEHIVDPIVNSTLFKVVTELAEGCWIAIKAIWEVVSEWFSTNVVEPVKKFFTDLWNGIKDAASTTWDAIVAVWTTVKDWFSTNVIEPVKKFFVDLWNAIKTAASTAWEGIKAVWTVVKEWFNTTVIQPVKQFFTTLWNGIKTAASDAWTKVKETWSVVKNWFTKTVVDPIKNAFNSLWDKAKSGAKDAWSGIKSVFSVISDWFKDKFSEAWTKVKNVFSTGGKIFDGIKEGITSAFKTVVNGIIKGINKVIAVPFNAINNMLDKIRNVSIAGVQPFSGLISRFSVPEIPLLEKGGVLKRGQVGFLEGNGAEAVVPLEKNKLWIRQVAKEMQKQMVGDAIGSVAGDITKSNVNNFTQIINAPKQPSRIELYRQTRNLLNLKGAT